MKTTATVAVSSAKTPGEVVFLAWEAYRAALTRHCNDLTDIDNRFGHCVPFSGVVVGSPSGATRFEMLKSMAEDFWERLVRTAEKHFSPHAAPLRIDRDVAAEACPIEVARKHWSARPRSEQEIVFNPVRTWDWLVATYGGQKGAVQALAQLAERLCNAFSFHARPPVQKSGYLVFHLRVCVDDFTKKHYKRNALSTQSRDNLCKALSALAEFAVVTERSVLADGLTSLRARFANNANLVPREKHPLGDRGVELHVVTYLDRVEFRLSMDTAERLQLFLGAYVPPHTESA